MVIAICGHRSPSAHACMNKGCPDSAAVQNVSLDTEDEKALVRRLICVEQGLRSMSEKHEYSSADDVKDLRGILLRIEAKTISGAQLQNVLNAYEPAVQNDTNLQLFQAAREQKMISQKTRLEALKKRGPLHHASLVDTVKYFEGTELQDILPSVSKSLEKATRSVCVIETTSLDEANVHPEEDDAPPSTSCSRGLGFVFGNNGGLYVLTNSHVIPDEDRFWHASFCFPAVLDPESGKPLFIPPCSYNGSSVDDGRRAWIIPRPSNPDHRADSTHGE